MTELLDWIKLILDNFTKYLTRSLTFFIMKTQLCLVISYFLLMSYLNFFSDNQPTPKCIKTFWCRGRNPGASHPHRSPWACPQPFPFSPTLTRTRCTTISTNFSFRQCQKPSRSPFSATALVLGWASWVARTPVRRWSISFESKNFFRFSPLGRLEWFNLATSCWKPIRKCWPAWHFVKLSTFCDAVLRSQPCSFVDPYQSSLLPDLVNLFIKLKKKVQLETFPFYLMFFKY